MSKTILVVDDEILNRELLRSYLELKNYSVLEASNAAEGRKLLNQEKPDLILLDVMMPGEDGFSFCEYIKSNWQEPFLPVILITALYDKESRITGLSAGADDFLSKPLDRLELMIKVRNMLRTREFHQNIYQEIVFARQVQESLFFDISFLKKDDFLFYKPFREVSGDLIEVWEKPGERWALVADATGHGPSAALISMAVKAILNKNKDSPGTLFASLNEKLFGLLTNNDLSHYVTGTCIRIKNDELTFVGAGHPPIYLKDGQNLIPLVSKQLPIGLLEKQVFQETKIPFKKGNLLFMYSDGLLEIMEEQILKNLLSKETMEIQQELEQVLDEIPLKDDLSILALNL